MKCLASIVVAFLVGTLLGVLVGARFRPNHVQFRVEDSKKLYLVPDEGDIIEWGTESPKTRKATVYFLGNIPCEGAFDGARCVFKPAAQSFINYNYICLDDKKSLACLDPGWGGGGGSQTGKDNFFQKILLFFDRALVVVATFFAGLNHNSNTHLLGTQQPEQPPASTAAGTEVSGGAQAESAVDTLDPFITCDPSQNNKAVLYPDPGSGTQGYTVTAATGATIEWEPGTSFSFAVDPNVCAPGNVNQVSKSCIAGQPTVNPVKTTVTTGCTGTPNFDMFIVIHP